VGTPKQQAAVLLHELGHNLNLAHGGNEEVNLKPNYISVMNYLYLSSGITNLARKNRIDYSGTALPTLNENKLFEPSGVSDGLDFIHYFCPADSRPTGDCLTDGAVTCPRSMFQFPCKFLSNSLWF